MIKPVQYTPGMPITFPSLVVGMPASIYHATHSADIGTTRPLSIASKGGLDLVNRSPAHYRYAEPKEQTRPMVIGSAIHCALLERDIFAKDYLLLKEAEDRRCSEYKAAVKNWPKGDDYVLTGPEADNITGMQEALYADKHTRGALTLNGYREASLFVRDPVTGIGVRVRFDILSLDGIIVDLKRTTDARPEQFRRRIQEFRHHVQGALYSDAYEWAFGEPPKGYGLLAFEPVTPWARKVYRLDSDAMAEGRRLYRADLDLFAKCDAENEWPAYDSDAEYIGLPPWVQAQIDAEEEVDGDTGTAH